MLPPSIQVCPVEIPGRGRLQGKAPIHDVCDLASMLAQSLPLWVSCTSLSFCALPVQVATCHAKFW